MVTDGTATEHPHRCQGLTIHVVATTTEGTRAALTEASRLARGLDIRVVLLVPHAVPFGEPLDGPSRRPAHSADRFRAVANECGDDVVVRVVVCRPDTSDLVRLLPHDATLLVGGVAGRFWPTREERITRAFAAKGLRVLFVKASARTRP